MERKEDTSTKNRKKNLFKKYNDFDKLEKLPYAFKIIALYELAIRNPKNLKLIQEIIKEYTEHKEEIEYFISINEVDINYDYDGEDNLYQNGQTHYYSIENKLIAQDIFPFQQYNEQSKKIYMREEIFDSKIFDVVNMIYPHYQFVQQGFGNQSLTVFNIEAETRIDKYLNKDSETTKILYASENQYSAETHFNYDRSGYESTEIELDISSDIRIIVHYSNASVFVEYIKTIEKDNLLYRELIECTHESELYELYQQLIYVKSYQALQSFLQSDNLIKIVKYKQFDNIYSSLPYRTHKNVNVIMRPDFLITSIENKKINQKKVSELYSIDSILLDEIGNNDYDSVKFLFLKNLLKKQNDFIRNLSIYDALEVSINALSVRSKKVPNFLYDDLIIDNNLKIPKKTLQNEYSKFKSLIDSSYYRYF